VGSFILMASDGGPIVLAFLDGALNHTHNLADDMSGRFPDAGRQTPAGAS
jgi:hypothetical protein